MNFQQIAQGVNTAGLLKELLEQPELWNKNPSRLSKMGPHHESQDIFIRYKNEEPNFENAQGWLKFSDEHISEWYKSIDFLPSCKPLIFDLMAAVKAEMLGGVLIYKLEPGAKIYPHQDHGWHPEFYDKFNICLQSNPEAAFCYKEDQFVQKAGDVHFFKNDVTHSVVNNGDCAHIVMVVCVRLDRGFRVPWSPAGWSLEKQCREALCQHHG